MGIKHQPLAVPQILLFRTAAKSPSVLVYYPRDTITDIRHQDTILSIRTYDLRLLHESAVLSHGNRKHHRRYKKEAVDVSAVLPKPRQVLQALQNCAADALECRILECPAGLQALVEVLRDPREEVRNEVILLLGQVRLDVFTAVACEQSCYAQDKC